MAAAAIFKNRKISWVSPTAVTEIDAIQGSAKYEGRSKSS